jgi:alkylhydroperoxidase family enzyme
VLSRALDVDTVVHIADGTDDDPEREAIGRLARKVAANPAQVTAADLAPLRDRGFSDADILDVVLATAIRCFFSTVLSATGAEPDTALLNQDATLKDALMVKPDPVTEDAPRARGVDPC